MRKPVTGLALAASLLAASFAGCDFKTPPKVSTRDVYETPGAARVDFSREVLPILERSCFPCHGPERDPLSAGFRLDLEEHAVGGGKIVPGDPDGSLLIKRLITKQDSKRMPPLKSDNPQLTDVHIDLLKRWVKEGASYDTGEGESKPGNAAIEKMPNCYTEQKSADVREGLARRVQEGWSIGIASCAIPLVLTCALLDQYSVDGDLHCYWFS